MTAQPEKPTTETCPSIVFKLRGGLKKHCPPIKFENFPVSSELYSTTICNTNELTSL